MAPPSQSQPPETEGVRKLPAISLAKTQRFCVRCGPTQPTTTRPGMESTNSYSTKTRNSRTPNWFYGSSVHNNQVICGTRRKNLSLPGIDPGVVNNPLNQITEDVRLQKVQDWLRRSNMPGNGTAAAQNIAAEELLCLTERKPVKSHMNRLSKPQIATGQKHRQSRDPFQHPYVVPIKNKDLLPGSMVPLAMDSERFDPDKMSTWHGRHQDFTQSQTPQQPLRKNVGPIGRPHSPEIPLIQKQRHRFGSNVLYGHQSQEKPSSYQDYQMKQQHRDELHAKVKTLLMQ